jgi:hypothetical protein
MFQKFPSVVFLAYELGQEIMAATCGKCFHVLMDRKQKKGIQEESGQRCSS